MIFEEKTEYIGKRDLPPSWDGGGWGGPKEGHDKDTRFMLRGEARDLPDYLYKSWEEHNHIETVIEKQMAKRDNYQFSSAAAANPSSESSWEEEEKKNKKEKKKKEKDKKKKGKKNKKVKKDKKKKKGKKEKDKKDKKAKKKRKSMG